MLELFGTEHYNWKLVIYLTLSKIPKKNTVKSFILFFFNFYLILFT